MTLNAKSLKILLGIHPDLATVVRHCAAEGDMDFIVTEGLRTEERQRELLAAGASTTMRSRHLTGHAVDLAVLVGGVLRWDWPLYHKLAAEMKISAAQCQIPIEAGADWVKFPDGPHYQLPWKEYA